MSDQSSIVKEASEEFVTVLRWVLSGLIEGIFIICWVLTQWAVNEYVVTKFQVDGISNVILTIAQWLFGFATLIPILARIVIISGKIIIRTYRSLKQELDGVAQ